MRHLGVVEAANEIRGSVRLQHMNPHEQHQLRYAEGVLDQLGLEHSPEALTHVFGLLREHEIDIPGGDEYPKWVKRGYDGKDMVADNADHEAEIINAAPPSPPAPPEPEAPHLDSNQKPAETLDIDGSKPLDLAT